MSPSTDSVAASWWRRGLIAGWIGAAIGVGQPVVATAGSVILFRDQFSALDMSADGSVIVGNSIPGNGTRWTPSGGYEYFDFPGYGDGFTRVSGDGSVILANIPGPTSFVPGAQLWTVASGVIANPPAIPTGNSGWGVLLSGDAQTIALVELIPVGPFDPDEMYIWKWSAADGYVPIAPTTTGPTAISSDGDSIIFQAESTGNGVPQRRWTSSGGVEVLTGIGGATNAAFLEGMSADGTVLVGSWTPTCCVEQEAIVWSDAGGLTTLGVPGVAGDPVRSVARQITADGSIVFGEFERLGGSTSSTAPFLWTAGGGFSLPFDVLASQGIRIQGMKILYGQKISDDGTKLLAAVWANGESRSLLIDLDPASVSQQTEAVAGGLFQTTDWMGGVFATGGVTMHLNLDAPGELTAAYRSLPPSELGAFLPDLAGLLALAGPQQEIAAWTFDFDGVQSAGWDAEITLTYPEWISAELEPAMAVYGYDGASWTAWPIDSRSVDSNWVKVIGPLVPMSMVVLASPTSVPLAPWVALWLALGVIFIAIRRLRVVR